MRTDNARGPVLQSIKRYSGVTSGHAQTTGHTRTINRSRRASVMCDRTLKRSQIATIVGSIAIGLAAGQAWGAGFQLNETSASGLGNAFAGGAAEAQDASTVWSNPAGMSKLTSPQVAAVVNLITPSFKLENSGSQPAFLQPLGN